MPVSRKRQPLHVQKKQITGNQEKQRNRHPGYYLCRPFMHKVINSVAAHRADNRFGHTGMNAHDAYNQRKTQQADDARQQSGIIKLFLPGPANAPTPFLLLFHTKNYRRQSLSEPAAANLQNSLK